MRDICIIVILVNKMLGFLKIFLTVVVPFLLFKFSCIGFINIFNDFIKILIEDY